MIPKSHPRYKSLRTRDKIVDGVKRNITSIHGLIAHGRGEAFDYLIGEKTTAKARKQIKKAAKLLLKAKNPVISVNGNVAALCAREIVQLSKAIPAKLEVNIFHKGKKREQNIKKWLIKHGAKEVLMPGKGVVKYIKHNRKFCNPDGIAKADVVFVPLEDGDRCEALIKMGKKVITIDLNAKSRTANFATITIVDNITRALPLLIKEIKNTP
jgi:4-phosphopantoate--beta-alanine ligase